MLKVKNFQGLIKKCTLTNLCAFFAVVSFIGVTLFVFLYYLHLDTGMAIVNYNETKSIAITLFFSKLESIGKISLTLVGVLWAFVIYTGNRMNIRSNAQKILFLATNLFLLFSFVTYFWGYDFLLGRLFYYSAIDLEAPIVQFYTYVQLVYFIFGIICFVLTILLCLEEA